MNNDTNGMKEHFVGGFKDEIEMINHEHNPNEAYENCAQVSNAL